MMIRFPRYTEIAVCLALAAGITLTVTALPRIGATERVAPKVADCFNYQTSGTKDQAASAPAVDCTTPHTAQTYWVGNLSQRFGVPAQASTAARLAATLPCTIKNVDTFLGLGDRKLPSRFQSIPVFPSKAQWDAGERWVRCDLVFRAGRAAQQLTTSMSDFVAQAPPDQFNFCTPGVPGNRTTSAYPCTNVKKNWIMILERDLGSTPTKRFPGSRSVEGQTKKICEKAAKPYVTLKKYYPWWAIWPTSAGWSRGDRTAQCFVPYSEFVSTAVNR